MFTRQHYKAIADILGRAGANSEEVSEFCTLFREDNPRFDEKRFRDAVQETYELQQTVDDPAADTLTNMVAMGK
jgi:predicted lipid-binding transport protein (Tim44 family)